MLFTQLEVISTVQLTIMMMIIIIIPIFKRSLARSIQKALIADGCGFSRSFPVLEVEITAAGLNNIQLNSIKAL